LRSLVKWAGEATSAALALSWAVASIRILNTLATSRPSSGVTMATSPRMVTNLSRCSLRIASIREVIFTRCAEATSFSDSTPPGGVLPDMIDC
jgi:hypothetical protein